MVGGSLSVIDESVKVRLGGILLFITPHQDALKLNFGPQQQPSS